MVGSLAEGQATSSRLVIAAFLTLRAVCVSGPRGRELEEETKRGMVETESEERPRGLREHIGCKNKNTDVYVNPFFLLWVGT